MYSSTTYYTTNEYQNNQYCHIYNNNSVDNNDAVAITKNRNELELELELELSLSSCASSPSSCPPPCCPLVVAIIDIESSYSARAIIFPIFCVRQAKKLSTANVSLYTT